MEPDQIRLHCSNCDPSTWVDLIRARIAIRLNLERDEYEFFADCPRCKGEIYNTRRAFSR